MVDAAADYLIACGNVARQALARKRRRIQRRSALDNHTVQGNTFSGLYHKDFAYANFLWINGYNLTATLHIRSFGPDIHQTGDGGAGLAHSITLEQLADLVKQHNGHCLGIFTNRHSANGCDGH